MKIWLQIKKVLLNRLLLVIISTIALDSHAVNFIFNDSKNENIYIREENGGSANIGSIIIDGKEVSNSNPGIRGAGKSKVVVRRLNDFHELIVGLSADIHVKAGLSPSLKIEGDDNIVGLIKAEVNDGTLTLGATKSYTTRNPLVLSITVPIIDAISHGGSGDVNVVGLNAQKIKLDIVGAGDIRVSGKASRIEAIIVGSGDLDLKQLESRDGTVRISGSGDAVVNVKESLSVVIDGSGDVYSYGAAKKVYKNISGAGELITRFN